MFTRENTCFVATGINRILFVFREISKVEPVLVKVKNMMYKITKFMN